MTFQPTVDDDSGGTNAYQRLDDATVNSHVRNLQLAAMQWHLVFKVVVLLTIANGLPIIGGKLFGRRLDQPVDRGVIFVDGRPFFGHSKTIRGVVLSLLATTASARVLGFTWVCGLVVASVSMSGDLIASFLKRRLSLPPNSRATGIDQIPESLLPTMAVRSTIGLSAFDVASVVVIFCLWQMLLSRLLFRWNIRKRPY